MSRILLAGFEGNNNSAKVLLDKLSAKEHIDKLYLKNNFDMCASQITKYIQKNYDLIIAFGQKPLIKSIYLERYGCIGGKNYATAFEYEPLKSFLAGKGYKVKISDNAGNYLCNHVYGAGLGRIEQQKKSTQYIFVHIPYIKNTNIDTLASAFNEYIAILLMPEAKTNILKP